MQPLDIVLASASPRRRTLLAEVWDNFEVVPSSAEGPILPGRSPIDHAMGSALAKAREVGERRPACLVIGADTIVVLDETVMGKPSDAEEAKRMLRRLSGKTHQVITGVAVVHMGSGVELVDFGLTDVTFKDISDESIDRYVAGSMPLDKAGAYGIQEVGEAFVESFDGDQDNVIGLPMELLTSMFDEALDLIHRNLTKTY